MSLKEWIGIIKKQKLIVIVVTVLVVLATFLFSVFSKPTYEAGVSFIFRKENLTDQTNSSFYQFDDFYSLQAGGMFADSIIAWLATPGVAADIYRDAGLPIPEMSIKNLAKSFRAKRKTGTNVIDAVLKADTRVKAQTLADTVSTVVQKKATEIQPNQPPTRFKVIAQTPTVVEVKSNVWVNTAIGLIVGLILGLILAYSTEYFRKEQ